MYYVGCDQHKHYSVVAVKDEVGTMIDQSKLYHNDKEQLRQYFSSLPKGTSLVLEASGFEPWLCDVLQDMEFNVKMAHPLKTKAIAEKRIKTDKLSAGILADLLRADLISEAYIASPQIRQQRYLMRYRQGLVKIRTLTKNKVHSLIDRLGIIPPNATDLFGTQGRLFLNQLKLVKPYSTALEGYLSLIDTFGIFIQNTEKEIRHSLKDNTESKLLRSLPGIGLISAATALAEIGTIERFSSSNHLTSYAGMVPSLHQSGKVSYSGRITKQGNKYLRWIFTEAAHTAVRIDPHLAMFYQKLKAKKGSHKAIIAVGRKLLVYAYHILKKQEPYRSNRG